MEESKLNNIEVFKKEFIKHIKVDKVIESFEGIKSFDELKENRIFRNLFKNIAEDVDIVNEIDCCGEEFITDYSRDILLMTKWFEHLESEGKSISNDILPLLIKDKKLKAYICPKTAFWVDVAHPDRWSKAWDALFTGAFEI